MLRGMGEGGDWQVSDADALKILDILKRAAAGRDPKLTAWTYEDFHAHMVGRLDLQARSVQGVDSTAKCRVRYLRFLEAYAAAPVGLRPPDEGSWIRHVAYRREHDGLAPTAVEQYRRAMVSFLDFLGVARWESLRRRPRAGRKVKRIVPDHLVPRFWMELRHPHRTVQATLRSMAHLGFHTGLRPPSEIVGLRLDDIEWDARCILVRAVKKKSQERILRDLPAAVLDPLWVHIETERNPRAAAPEVYVTAAGTPWKPTRVGPKLGAAGREIWEFFRPYSMRDWFTIKHLETHRDIEATARIAGTTVKVLQEDYLQHVRGWERAAGLWVSVDQGEASVPG